MLSLPPDRSLILILTLKLTLDRTLYLNSFQRGGVNRIQEIRETAGGKGVNVARALRSLGWQDLLSVGIVGGPTGTAIVDRLAAEGIPGEYIQAQSPCAVDYILRESPDGPDTALYDQGRVLRSGEIQALQEKYLALLPMAAVSVLCGKSPCPETDGFFRWTVTVSRDHGVPCIVDTSGDSLKEVVYARPFMVKPNMEEAQQFLGRPCLELPDRIQAAKNLCGDGIELVVISAGKQETVVGFQGRHWVAVPPLVASARSVGCGDSMVAGFVLGLLKGLRPEECIGLGVACGSANCLAPSAGKLSPDTVKELVRQVHIREV